MAVKGMSEGTNNRTMGEKPGLKPMSLTQHYTASQDRGRKVSLTEATQQGSEQSQGLSHCSMSGLAGEGVPGVRE